MERHQVDRLPPSLSHFFCVHDLRNPGRHCIGRDVCTIPLWETPRGGSMSVRSFPSNRNTGLLTLCVPLVDSGETVTLYSVTLLHRLRIRPASVFLPWVLYHFCLSFRPGPRTSSSFSCGPSVGSSPSRFLRSQRYLSSTVELRDSSLTYENFFVPSARTTECGY